MPMNMPKALITFAIVAALSSVSRASEYENDDDDRSGHVPVVAREIVLLGPAEAVDPAVVRADFDYIAGMVPHHQGALTMSQDYLADPRGTIRRVYDWLGLDLEPHVAETIFSWQDANAMGAKGTHRYTAEQFGLSAEQIRSDYDFYIRHFDVAVEG